MIVLVGFMGAGKTTVGELLAHRLGLPFMDTDAAVVERAGLEIAEIFATQGEAAFRELEGRVVAEALAGEDAVVALGGGALSDPAIGDALEDVTVVHLFVDFDEAMRRVGGDPRRPLLAGDVRGLYGRRLGTYEVAADDYVQTDDLTPDDVVEEILQRLHLAPEAPPPGRQSRAASGGAPARPARSGAPPPPPVPAPEEVTRPPAPEEIAAPPAPAPEEIASAAPPTAPAEGLRGGVGAASSPLRITVAAPSRSYDVVVGTGILEDAADFVAVPEDAEKAFIVTHSSLLEKAGRVAKSFEAAGLRSVVIEVPEGEGAKTLAGAAHAYDLMAAARATRHDLVVGVGGGVVNDLAGFVASTFNRGMAVVQVPTTLLAQVDAAIGGKTAVNLPEAKNKVGTFHQPIAVVCDIGTLHSLPQAELVSGMAEVVKYGLIADGGLLERVLHESRRLHERDEELLVEIVGRSVAVKAEVVAEDEREGGRRAVLNYGHTVGHAIEIASDYRRFRHGEAISLGMVAAAHIGRELWGLDDELLSAHVDPLTSAGLPTSARIDPDDIEDALAQDKKYRRGVRFVLLKELAMPQTDVLVPSEIVRQSIERLQG